MPYGSAVLWPRPTNQPLTARSKPPRPPPLSTRIRTLASSVASASLLARDCSTLQLPARPPDPPTFSSRASFSTAPSALSLFSPQTSRQSLSSSVHHHLEHNLRLFQSLQRCWHLLLLSIKALPLEYFAIRRKWTCTSIRQISRGILVPHPFATVVFSLQSCFLVFHLFFLFQGFAHKVSHEEASWMKIGFGTPYPRTQLESRNAKAVWEMPGLFQTTSRVDRSVTQQPRTPSIAAQGGSLCPICHQPSPSPLHQVTGRGPLT